MIRFESPVNYEIKVDCFPSAIRIDSTKPFAWGSYGRVYEASKDDVKLVVKIIPLDALIPDMVEHEWACTVGRPETYHTCAKQSLGDFRLEVLYFKYASRNGIAPEFFFGGTCEANYSEEYPKEFKAKRVGIIISRRVDVTLSDYLKSEPRPPFIRKLIDDLNKKVSKAGLDIQDTKDENIGLMYEGSMPSRAYYIDIGHVTIKKLSI